MYHDRPDKLDTFLNPEVRISPYKGIDSSKLKLARAGTYVNMKHGGMI